MKNVKHKIGASLMTLLMVVGVSACSGGGGSARSGGSVGSGEGSFDPSEDEILESPAGQRLVIDVSDASALALMGTSEAGVSNFKKIVGSQLKDVIRAEHVDAPVLSLNVEAPELGEGGGLPQVSRFYLSPEGNLVLVLANQVALEGQACQFLHVTRSDNSIRCIDPAVRYITDTETVVKGRPGVQFDAFENVYYQGPESLNRWSPETGEIDALSNENMSINDFFVSPDSSVWVRGHSKVADVGFFRRIRPDGSLQEVTGISPHYFILADEGRLILSGAMAFPEYQSGLYLVRFDDTVISEPELFLESYSDLIGYNGKQLNSGGTDKILPAGNGHHYGLIPGDPYGVRSIVDIFPEAPQLVPVDGKINSVGYFKVFDEDLYYVAQESSGRHVFRKKSLDGFGADEDLLDGADIEIYHFTVVNHLIYFDGLRFSDNSHFIGQIDQNNGNTMTELSTLEAELIGLELL